MTERDQDAAVERIPTTSGRFTGVLGLVVVGVVLVFDLRAWDAGAPLGIAIGTALAGVLVWVAMLRPAVWVTDGDLVLRGMFHSDHVPLAAIDMVAVSHVLTVKVGDRSYVSPAIGYSARKAVKERNKRIQGSGAGPFGQPVFAEMEPRATGPAEASSPQAFAESRLNFLAQDARDRAGIAQGSPEQGALAAQARRTWAWVEIVACGLLTLGFVAWVVVGRLA